MLNPSNDRLDYGELLSPPAGYQVDFAVGTTYSLDLDALVGASIALGFSEETDSNLLKNPVFLLEALRSTGDKIALFCEGGQIHFPARVTALYVLLEQVVFQITTKKKKSDAYYPSFHPKTWVIRFISDKGQVLYRFMVLSRNLTFDRSWDVTFSMEGELGDTATEKNGPLINFLEYLQRSMKQDNLGREKAKKIRALIKELPFVELQTGMKEFYDFDFIPTGIPDVEGRVRTIKDYPLYKYFGTDEYATGFDETFIMSPFLSRSVVQYFNHRNDYISGARQVLITRAMSLGKLKLEDCSNLDLYVVKDDVIDGESYISEEGENHQKEDIHAKVYMTRRGADTDLYLGSLNASLNAVEKNVEFMIRLRSKNRYLNLDKLEKSLFGENEGDASNPFQKVDVSEYAEKKEDSDGSSLDQVIKEILRKNPNGCVISNGEFYDLALHIDPIDTEYKVVLNPLFSKKTESLKEEMLFTKLSITQLSEFYSIEVSNGDFAVQRVVKIPTVGIPEGRDAEVVSSVVSDRASFYRYIAFLLGDDTILSSIESDAVFGDMKAGGRNTPLDELPPLYEKMLRTATSPDAEKKFGEIDYLIKSISKDGVVPEHFNELYETFKKVVDHK